MEKGTWEIKKGFAEMFKGGVIMDVTTAEQAKVAEEAGAVAVMAPASSATFACSAVVTSMMTPQQSKQR